MLTLARSLSQSKLSRLCNISQPIISNIINNKEFKLSSAKCREFGQWYVQFMIRSQSAPSATTESTQTAQVEEEHPSNKPGSSSQAATTPQLPVAAAAPQPSTSASDARLTFHPKLEVPRLIEWFQLNRSPSERQLIYYADLLNRSSLRAERNKVTVKSLKNWWKNYKAKQRNESKAEKRPKRMTDID